MEISKKVSLFHRTKVCMYAGRKLRHGEVKQHFKDSETVVYIEFEYSE